MDVMALTEIIGKLKDVASSLPLEMRLKRRNVWYRSNDV